MVSKPFPYRAVEEMDVLERQFLDQVSADFIANQPGLVIVQVRDWKQGFGLTSFDFIEYYSRDAGFAAQFAKYDRLTKIRYFEVYKRREAGPGSTYLPILQ